MNEKLRKRLICLCEAAVFVALATVLNLLTFSATWAQGGSVSFTMIPLIILALRRGPLWGMAAGLVFGLIDCTMGGGFGYGLPSVLVDYLAAYALVGTAGFFRRVKGGAIIGTVVGCFLNAFLLLPTYAVAFGMPIEGLVEMGTAVNGGITNLTTFVLFAVAPFNLLKGVLVSLIVFIIYKKISPIFRMH